MPPMSTTLQIGRIDTASDDARGAILALRRQLSPRGDVVSPQGRARTISAFGEPLTPQEVVGRICDDVQARGLKAVLEYTAKLDGVKLRPDQVRVSTEELRDAHRKAEPAYLKTIQRVRANVMSFQAGILNRDATMRRGRGCELQLRYRPLRRVGICIPVGAGGLSVVAAHDGPCRAQAAGVGGDRRASSCRAHEVRRV